MPLMTGSRFFAEAMQAKGITHVFLVPTIVTPALAEMHQMGITCVTAHSEKAAVYMADGYARMGRRAGICMCQAVGAANLAAGLRDPFLACSPVIAIAAGRFPETKYRHVYQEIDDMPLFAPLTKFSAQVDMVERLPDLLRQAFRSALSDCPGPVHLELAGNFGQVTEGSANLAREYDPQIAQYPVHRPVADAADIAEAAKVLSQARRPVIVAGGGVTRSAAQAEVVMLAEKLNMPVATSLSAKGAIAENHRLSVGVVGSYSRDCANRVVAGADLVFYIGSRTGGQVTHSWQIPRPNTAVMQLDIAGEELGRNYPNVASMCGDVRATLQALLAVVEPLGPNPAWLGRVEQFVQQWRSDVARRRDSNATPMRPERICREIEAHLPADAVLVSDTGHAGIWTGTHIELHHPTQTYLRAVGSLGWGLPAAIGAKCAAPQRPVICFTGDGGFYYHMGELETAVRYGVPVVIVVNDNHSLNQEAPIFNAAYGGRQTTGLEMWQFNDVDLSKVAEAMGCYAVRVMEPADIGPALLGALASGRPALVDVVSDLAAVAPDPWS